MVDELRIGSLPWERVTHTAQPIARPASFSGGQIVLPNIQVRPLPSAPDDIVIPAMHLETDEGGNVLAVPNCRQGHRRAVSGGREGSFYLVRDGRLIGKGTREGQEFPVCDAVLDRVLACKAFVDMEGGRHIRYRFRVSSCKWSEPKEIEVEKQDVRRIFHSIHEMYPEIALYQKNTDVLEELISDVFEASKDVFETFCEYEASGWYEEDGKGASYHKGTHHHYGQWVFPNVERWSQEKRVEVFRAGLSFRAVGQCGKEIGAIFLYGHMGYSLFWFRKAGADIVFMLFAKGINQSLKTATTVEIVDPFDEDIRRRQVQLTDSSWSGIRQSLLLSRDSVLLVDDFSKTERTLSKEAGTNIERLVRAIGNGKLAEKKKPGGVGEQPTEIRTLAILTGEDDPEAGASSFMRMLTIAVDRNTFDGEALRKFQSDRSIMREYFALYIHFLEKNPAMVISTIQTARTQHLADVTQWTLEPRLRETALSFLAQAYLVAEFGIWCGVASEEMQDFLAEAKDHVAACIRDNDSMRRQVKSSVLFVKAVWEQTMDGNTYYLAENAEVYHQHMGATCIGFVDEARGYLWLKMEAAMEAAQKYCMRHGLFLTRNSNIIKKSLYDDGILDKPPKRWVWRWTRGESRERFVRLFLEKVRKIAEEDEN